MGVFRGPVDKIWQSILKGLDLIYTLPEGEHAAINHLNSQAPNVRTIKTLNLAYLDPRPRPLLGVYRLNLLTHNQFYWYQSNLGLSVRLLYALTAISAKNARKWVFFGRGPAPCWAIVMLSWQPMRLIILRLSFKFQSIPTTNGWVIHFWNFENCHFSKSNWAYLKAP